MPVRLCLVVLAVLASPLHQAWCQNTGIDDLLDALPGASKAASGDAGPVEVQIDPTRQWGAVARLSPDGVKAGETVSLEVVTRTSRGWHIYDLQGDDPNTFYTRFELGALPAGVSVPPDATWEGPEPSFYMAFGKPTQVFEGENTFRLPLLVAEDAAPGEHELTVRFQAMACNDTMCMPKGELNLTARLKITDGSQPLAIEVSPEFQWGAVAEVVPSRAPAGSSATLRVHVQVGRGWHIYDLEGEDEYTYYTNFQVEPWPAGVSARPGARWTGPEPIQFPAFGKVTPVFEGRVTFELPIQVGASAPVGAVELPVKIGAMACSDMTCMAKRELPLTARFEVVPAVAGSGADAAGLETPELVPVSTASEGETDTSYLGLLVIALLGAMVSWIMPCVYPMIPITISFFGKQAEEKRTGRVALASSYGTGIAGTFLLIGLAVGTLSLSASNSSDRSDFATLGNAIATNPWLNLVIGLVFIAFALSMFGLFELRVPNWLINRTDTAGRGSRSAHVGSLLLGVTFALASFTCTVPVVGLLLATAATGTADGFARSMFGMGVYGLVFAAPFVALSLFPGILSRLPKAGGWMETVKVGFGFLELAVAIKFLWVPDIEWQVGLLPRPVVLGLFALVGVATVAFFLGFLHVGHAERVKPLRVGVGRWMLAIGTLALLAPVALSLKAAPKYQARGMPGWVAVGMEVLLPPPPNEDELARQEGWFVDDYQAALDRAREEDLPLFIDFTGIYCGNCRAMEQTVFVLDEVRERFDEMVLCRLYVDRDTPESEEYRVMQVERFGIASQPYYVVLDPRDEKVLAAEGGYIPNAFLGIVDAGLQKFRDKRPGAP